MESAWGGVLKGIFGDSEIRGGESKSCVPDRCCGFSSARSNIMTGYIIDNNGRGSSHNSRNFLLEYDMSVSIMYQVLNKLKVQ